MRKLALALLLLMLPATAFGTSATHTKNTVPSSNASFLTDLQTFMKEEDAERQNDWAFGFVASGGTHSTGAGLLHTPASLTAYPGGFLVVETGSITYGDDTTCWVIVHTAITGTLSGGGGKIFERVSGTHYLIDCTAASKPTLPTSAAWLMKVVTASGSVTTVTDLRTRVPYLYNAESSSDLPTASALGRLGRAEDTNALLIDNGSSWEAFTAAELTCSACVASSEIVTALAGKTLDILKVTGTSPNVIGSSTANNNFQLFITGTFTPANSDSSAALYIDSSIAAVAGNHAAGMIISPTITEAASGTHSVLAGLTIQAPVITSGAAATTNTASLYVVDAPTGGTNNYAAFIEAGNTRLNGRLLVANNITTGNADGDIVLANLKFVHWVNNAGTSSSNFGIVGNASDAISFDVPATTGVFGFTFAGTERFRIKNENAGAGILFLSESSADHSAPSANQVVVYAKDNGAGKTTLCGRFATGAVQCFASEP